MIGAYAVMTMHVFLTIPGYDVEAEIENSFGWMLCDLADAGLVDARAFDSEKYIDEVY